MASKWHQQWRYISSLSAGQRPISGVSGVGFKSLSHARGEAIDKIAKVAVDETLEPNTTNATVYIATHDLNCVNDASGMSVNATFVATPNATGEATR